VILLAGYLAFLISVREATFWIGGGLHPVGVKSPDSFVEAFINSVGRQDLPVVFSSGIDYLPNAFYASPEWAKRFVSLVDPVAAVTYAGSDNVDTAMIGLQSYLPLQVYDFSAFASRHPVFLLYGGDESSQFDWWPKRLTNDGDSIQTLATAGTKKIYLVTLKSH
jgi:hypothetical protein